MKKIIAIVLVLAAAFTCVACSSQNTAKTPETRKFTYTIINETGTAVDRVQLADDNSAAKAEIKHDGGMANGVKGEITIDAVPDKDGNPSLSITYNIGSTEYTAKVNVPAAEIKLTAEGPESGAFDIVAAPAK